MHVGFCGKNFSRQTKQDMPDQRLAGTLIKHAVLHRQIPLRVLLIISAYIPGQVIGVNGEMSTQIKRGAFVRPVPLKRFNSP